MIVGCCCLHKNKQKCVSRGSPAPLVDCQLPVGQLDWPEPAGTSRNWLELALTSPGHLHPQSVHVVPSEAQAKLRP